MSAEQIQAAIIAIRKVRGTMALMTLTPEERRVNAPTRVGRELLILETRLEAAREHRDLLPSSFDLPQFEREIELTRVLRECLTVVNDLQQSLRDTLLTVGSGAVSTAGLVVGYLKLAAAPAEGLDRPKPVRRSSRPGAKTSSPPVGASNTSAPADAPASAPPSAPAVESVAEAAPVVPTRTAA